MTPELWTPDEAAEAMPPKRGPIEVQVVPGPDALTPAELDRWADRYIGYILEAEGLTNLPAEPDDEAA